MMTIEDQVGLVCEMLERVGRDPVFGPQSDFGGAVPCSFGDLDSYVRGVPSPAAGRIVDAAAARLEFTHALAGIDPLALDGLGSLAADDPRVPALAARLAAAWPDRDTVARIAQMYACCCRTLGDLARMRPQLAKGDPLGQMLDAAAGGLGKRVGDVATELEASLALIAGLVDFDPRPPALRQVAVAAPEINLLFSASGRLVANDQAAPLALAGAKGAGFLQSRHGAPGEPGTPAAGLIPYLYRLALEPIAGDAGVARLLLPVGAPAPLDFAAAGVAARGEIFAVTAGGLGTRAPTAASLGSDGLAFAFDPPLRAGDGSVFFGFAAAGPPVSATATAIDAAGARIDLACTVPAH